jgi:hypothetical protein
MAYFIQTREDGLMEERKDEKIEENVEVLYSS